MTCFARMLWIHSHTLTSSSSLTFFLPPPRSLALLSSSSDRRCSSALCLRHSRSLLGSIEKRLARCFSRILFGKFDNCQLKCQIILFSFCLHSGIERIKKNWRLKESSLTCLLCCHSDESFMNGCVCHVKSNQNIEQTIWRVLKDQIQPDTKKNKKQTRPLFETGLYLPKSVVTPGV